MSRFIESILFEDPLALLPRKPIQQHARKRVVYDAQRPPEGMYVVVLGRVKVIRSAADGSQTVSRIVAADGIFGELAMAGLSTRFESAIALEAARTMCWRPEEIEQQIQRVPKLGLALVQHLARQCHELEERIQCMAICKTPERVALGLVQLAESTGTSTEDGVMRMGGLTHHTLAEYIGTSREIVTFQLNRLRRAGLVKYTRRHIDVYSKAILEGLEGVRRQEESEGVRMEARARG